MIALIWDPCGRCDIESALSEMVAACDHDKSLEVEYWVRTGMGAAHFHNPEIGRLGGFRESGSHLIVLDGEFFGKGDSEAQLQFLDSRTQRDGERALCGLNGRYVAGLLDEATAEACVAVDRLGMRKLYLAQHKGGWVFASCCKAILAIPGFSRGFDEQGLSDFMSCDYAVGERTLFRGIRTVPYGSLIRLRGGTITTRRYWDFPSGQVGTVTDAETALNAAEFSERLAGSTVRQLRGVPDTVLCLTGGRDSRMLAYHMKQLDIPFSAVTYGHGGCYDFRFGGRVARALGIRRRRLKLRPSWLADWRCDAAVLCEGTATVCNCHTFAVSRSFKPAARRFVTGFMGDYLAGHYNSERYYAPDAEVQGFNYFAGDVMSGMSPADVQRLLRPPLRDRAIVGTREGLREVWDGIDGSSAYRVYCATLAVRARKHTSYHMDILDTSGIATIPFYDNELLDWLLHLPMEAMRSQATYREVLRNHLGVLSHVPLSGDGLAVSGDLRARFWRTWHIFWREQLPRQLFGEWSAPGRQKYEYLMGPWLHRRLGTDLFFKERRRYTHSLEWLRTGSRSLVEQLHHSPDTLAEFVEPDAVRRVATGFLAGRSDNWRCLCRLATLFDVREVFGL